MKVLLGPLAIRSYVVLDKLHLPEVSGSYQLIKMLLVTHLVCNYPPPARLSGARISFDPLVVNCFILRGFGEPPYKQPNGTRSSDRFDNENATDTIFGKNKHESESTNWRTLEQIGVLGLAGDAQSNFMIAKISRLNRAGYRSLVPKRILDTKSRFA